MSEKELRPPSSDICHPSSPRLHRVADQRLAERPYRTRYPMGGGNDVVEGVLDEVAILVRDDEGRQQLYGVARVSGHLSQHLVVLEQRNCDELAEQPFIRSLQKIPACLELQ